MKNLEVKNAVPYTFNFEIDKSALLIIDMQRDFCYEQGFGEALGNDVFATKAIIPTVETMLKEARKHGLLVIHTREGHRPDLTDLPHNKLIRGNGEKRIGDEGPMGRILVRGEYGHDIVDELKPIEGEPVIDKPGKGAFYQTDLETILKNKGIKYIFVAGVTSHVCVSTTIREANDRGFECLMLTDCSAAFDERDHLDTIHQITQQGGIFGWAASSQDVIKALNT
ncbi:MAG: cysteine hydrolase family protein [Brevinemataceae bacterium]